MIYHISDNSFPPLQWNVPFAVAVEFARLSWADVGFAVRRKLINEAFVISFAEKVTVEQTAIPDGPLLEILWGCPPIEYFCDQLALSVSKDELRSTRIWSCIILKWIETKYNELEESPRILHEALIQLGYPECFEEIHYIIANIAGNLQVYNRRSGYPLTSADHILIRAIGDASRCACDGSDIKG